MFPKIKFNRDEVSTINCFKDQEVIDKIHNKGEATAYLPKVEETYGKVIFPITGEYPYSFASIALSMDGEMAYPNRPEGVLIAKSNTLNENGALTDFYVLNFLRAYGDVVINGTKILVSEPNMWMTVYDDDLIEERNKNLGKKRPHPSNVDLLHSMVQTYLLTIKFLIRSWCQSVCSLHQKGGNILRNMVEINSTYLLMQILLKHVMVLR